MISQADKAIAAFLSGAFFFLGRLFDMPFFSEMSDETFLAIAGAVTTVIVWLVPNLKPAPPVE